MPLKTKLETDSKNAKMIRIASIIWAFIGVVGFFSVGEELGYYMTSIICFMGVGWWGYKVGTMKMTRVQRTYKYIQLIDSEPTGNIERMAMKSGMSPSIIKEELQDLIQKGYLQQAYINNETNCIVVKDVTNKIMTREVELEMVTCRHCIGNNKVIKGIDSLCQYCGSLLEV